MLTYKYDLMALYWLGAGLAIGHAIYCIRAHCSEDTRCWSRSVWPTRSSSHSVWVTRYCFSSVWLTISSSSSVWLTRSYARSVWLTRSSARSVWMTRFFTSSVWVTRSFSGWVTRSCSRGWLFGDGSAALLHALSCDRQGISRVSKTSG